MSTVQPGDTIAVYRSGTLYKTPADMSTLQDTDIIVVGRGNTPYKCTFADWKAGFNQPPAINTVVLAEDAAGAPRFTSQSFTTTVTMTSDGKPASTKALKGWVQGTLKSVAQTSPITAVNTNTYNPPANWSIYVGPGGAGPSQVVMVQSCAWPGSGTSRPSNTGGIPRTGGYAILDTGQAVAGVRAGYRVTLANYCTSLDGVLMGSHTGLANSWVLLDSTFGKKDLPGWSTPEALTGYGYRYFLYSITATKLPSATEHDFAISSSLGALDNGFIGAAIGTTTLTFRDNTALSSLTGGDSISEVTAAGGAGDAVGTISVVDATANTVSMVHTTGTWDVGSKVKGPTKTVANAKMFLKFNAAGAVSDLASADPGFVVMTGAGPYKLTFPATLPSGNAPDVDLPAGVTITTEVEAKNTSSAVTKTSNTVTPA
jgi:hypothetical protein